MSVNVRLLDNRVLISTLQEETTPVAFLFPPQRNKNQIPVL